jgi:hypothetical protein
MVDYRRNLASARIRWWLGKLPAPFLLLLLLGSPWSCKSELSTTLDGNSAIVHGRASDAGLYVSRVDVGFDDDATWYPAAPDDGLWDEPSEAFTLKLEGLPKGDHVVRIRVTDALGNSATTSRTVKI